MQVLNYEDGRGNNKAVEQDQQLLLANLLEIINTEYEIQILGANYDNGGANANLGDEEGEAGEVLAGSVQDLPNQHLVGVHLNLGVEDSSVYNLKAVNKKD